MGRDQIEVGIAAGEHPGHPSIELWVGEPGDNLDAESGRSLELREPIVETVVHRAADQKDPHSNRAIHGRQYISRSVRRPGPAVRSILVYLIGATSGGTG